MAFQGDSIFWVEVEKIVPNPFQPRRDFDEGKLKELAESVRMYGILQPLTVTRKEIPGEDGGLRTEYELIAGERRLRASKIAGLAQVPVIIRDSDSSEQEKLEIAIIENLQREDLNAVDRALAFQQLAEAFELSHTDVAKKVGRSREYVSNSIRLLSLPEYMLDSVKVADISEGHARTLLMLKDKPEEQDVVYREILLKKLSVREVERIARKIATDKVRKQTWKGTDPHLIEIEKEFTSALGTRVQIAKTDYGGKVTIDYFSEDDLQELLQLMKQREQKEQLARTEGENHTAPVVQTMTAMTAATALEAVDEPTAETDVTPIVSAEGIETTDAQSEQVEQVVPSPATTPTSSQEVVSTAPQTPLSTEPEVAPVSVQSDVMEVENNKEDEGGLVSPVNQAFDEAEDEMDAEEQAVVAAARAVAPERTAPADQSAAIQKEVETQIHELYEKEVSYTPPAPAPVTTTTPETEPIKNKSAQVADEQELSTPVAQPHTKEDESDLYSMKNFGI